MMNVLETAHLAYESLRANKLRAGLTMLGMAIGTSSIILVVSIALTSREYIMQQIQGVGSNLIYFYYEAGNTISGTRSRADDLNLADLDAATKLPGVANATGLVVNHDRIVLEGKEREITLIGTTPEYSRVRNLRLLSGRFFDDADERSFNKVCLLTRDLATRLFGTLEVGGRSIKLFRVRFEVIGVFKEGVETFGTSEVSTYSAVLPITVVQQFNNSDKLDEIYVSAESTEAVPAVTRRIQRLLEYRHRAGTSYRVENLAEILSAAGRIATAVTIILFLIGTISLVISGIGIMNIMLIAVTERTREIGLRMSLGARRVEVLYQFLAESIAMAGIGGSLGILLGISGPLMATWITDFDIHISPISILLAFLLSFTVGIISGLLPANRAARLDPAEALRYE